MQNDSQKSGLNTKNSDSSSPTQQKVKQSTDVFIPAFKRKRMEEEKLAAQKSLEFIILD